MSDYDFLIEGLVKGVLQGFKHLILIIVVLVILIVGLSIWLAWLYLAGTVAWTYLCWALGALSVIFFGYLLRKCLPTLEV